MKIVLLNTADSGGGAAVAARRLLNALNNAGKDAKMLVRDKKTEQQNILSVNISAFQFYLNYLRFLIERLVIFCCNGFRRKDLFKVSIADTGINLSDYPLVKEADIVHLHWINQGFLSLGDIKKIIGLKKPVVWTLHDMWPCTAICHHAWTCERFRDMCGKCPFLHSQKEKDLSYRVWKKKRFMRSSAIQIVAVSSWLAEKAKESSLTRGLPVTVIPNAIDTSVFYKKDKIQIRKSLNLPLDKKIVLMGAARLDDPIKGFDYLKQALEILTQKDAYRNDLFLVLFGNIRDEKSFLDNLSVPYLLMGQMKEAERIADLYSAADVTVVPSFYETFGQTLIEAMACGCPAVSFNNSGQTDIIDHKQNGYLAAYLNAEDFAAGISWVLEHADRISSLCMEKVQKQYTESVVAAKYLSLYNRLLK